MHAPLFVIDPRFRPEMEAAAAWSRLRLCEAIDVGPNALKASPSDGSVMLAVMTSDPASLLEVALAERIPTMLALGPTLEPASASATADAAQAFRDASVPFAGWLPRRRDARSVAVDSALGEDRLGGIVASRIVRLDARDSSPSHHLVDVVDLAVRWHGDVPTCVIALGPGVTGATTAAALRFADGGGALLESGTNDGLPPSGYDETLLIGRTRTLNLGWDPMHEVDVSSAGIRSRHVTRPELASSRLFCDFVDDPASVGIEIPATDLMTALWVVQAIDASARSGDTIDLDEEGRAR